MRRITSFLVVCTIPMVLLCQGVDIQLKVYLQGAYAGGGVMSTHLNTGNHLPLQQPYNTPVWNYTGTEVLGSIPANMVDWILVDLRRTPDTAVARKAFILYADGTVRDVNGNTSLHFDVPPGQYYAAVMHRSHLSAMSAVRLTLPAMGLLNFSDTTAFPIYGRCEVSLSGGIMAMIAGDINHDKILKYSGANNDRSPILQRILSVAGGTAINAIINGYYREDLRMDGNVKYSGSNNDPSLIIQNLVSLTGSNAINAIFTGPVPHAVFDPLPTQTFQQCGDQLTDLRDGQQYPTVQIGTQCWMAKNLNVGNFVNSNAYWYAHSDMYNNMVIEKYCQNNLESNCLIYGGLYEWNEAMAYDTTPSVQGICPDGWHIPTPEEWDLLSLFLGGDYVSGGLMKDTGTALWTAPNQDATNSSGFTAIPGGNRDPNGYFGNMGNNTTFWVSKQYDPNSAWYRDIGYNSGILVNSYHGKEFGFSVRCLSNTTGPCSPQPDQANAGPDSLNIQGNSIVLQANTPVNGSGQWTVISGQGGILTDDTIASTLFTGQAGTTYTLVWAISTICGSNSDTVVIGFALPGCGIITDSRDAQQYPTVIIGDQCWMAKNLNIGVNINGTGDQTNNSIIEKYCYDNDNANCLIYGGLYQWNEAMTYTAAPGVQGICPTGWHIPTDAEYCTLTTFLDFTGDCNAWDFTGTTAGSKLMESGFVHWMNDGNEATNESGFTALGAGARYTYGGFGDLNHSTYFWTSNATPSGNSIRRFLLHSRDDINRSEEDKAYGFSIRCVKDCTPQPDQANAGPDNFDIPGTSFQLQGNIPVNGSGVWRILLGDGGSFADSSQANTMLYSQGPAQFMLTWTISTPCGATEDTVIIGFRFPDCGLITDARDGQQYPTVVIGTQCWMAKNLNIGTFMFSDSTGTTHSNVSNNGTIEKYCYNNDPNYCNIYGGLYDWNEMMGYVADSGAQGICPEGWHLPALSEWLHLYAYLGGTSLAGAPLKEIGFAHWNQNLAANSAGTNASGFTGLPGGVRVRFGWFGNVGYYGQYWSSSASSITHAWRQILQFTTSEVVNNAYDMTSGLAVRCIKDCTPQPDQANAGPDSLNIPGTSITLQANQPVNGSGVWNVFSGTGGSFADSTVHNTIFTGQPSVVYALVWTINNQCGTSSDTVNISFADTSSSFCGGILTDTRDGQQYPTVQIGTQCWMAKNLNVGIYKASVSTSSSHSDVSNNGVIEKYCYNNDVANCAIYGGLYDWNEMMGYVTTSGVQGICPTGWHIPTDAEWYTLTDYLGGANVAGGKMKATGTTHWYSPNTGATNSSGFTAFGAGARGYNGYFYLHRVDALFWSSFEYSSTYGINRHLTYDITHAYRSDNYKTYGFSVRCLRDSIPPCTPQPDQANAGPDSLNIPDTSITLQANQPVNGTGTWSVFSGTGGSFADSSVHNTLFAGQVGVVYSLIWTISSPCGSTRDTVLISFADTSAYTCGGILTDTRDGQQYPTVQIGTQCWMSKNLNIGTMLSSSSNQTNNSTIEKYCYNNDANNCAIYGGLYQWDEMMEYSTTPGVQGICPVGWHIPTDAEWCTVTTYLDATVNCNTWGYSGTNAGGKMKATGTTHWYSPNTGATNSSGFTALGAGNRDYYGSFFGLRDYAAFWSSSEYSSTYGISWSLGCDFADVYRLNGYKTDGFSVRCLRNN